MVTIRRKRPELLTRSIYSKNVRKINTSDSKSTICNDLWTMMILTNNLQILL